MKNALLGFCSFTTVSLASLALATSTVQAQPQDTDPAEELSELGEMMSGLFGEAAPLSVEEEARLPIAKNVVAKLFPEGTYAQMMEESMAPMMDGLIGQIAGKPAAMLATLTGLDEYDLGKLDDAQLLKAANVLDPTADERNAAIGAVSVEMVTDVMNEIEPAYREGLTRAYATRFTSDELTDLDGFFSTKTGGRYAGESFLIYADPQVMSAMNAMMPAMMEMLPGMMERMSQIAEEFPAGRSYSQLSAAEQSEVAELLGVSQDDLAAAEPEDTDF